MPIEPFDGKTFVTFIDISGFKVLMKQNLAIRALDVFYRVGYTALYNYNQKNDDHVEGIFISDCGILFVRTKEYGTEIPTLLRPLLEVVEEINREMLKQGYMLTTSIAYGNFEYHPRKEFVGIEKNIIAGYPYVDAFLDNETGKPKLNPGLCRILINDAHNKQFKSLLNSPDDYFQRLRKTGKHLYFYWMLRDHSEIKEFKSRYSNVGKRNYEGILYVLKESALEGSLEQSNIY
jgi:hypothetical protein